MAKYAIVKDGQVINSVEWDGVSDWTPPKGTELIQEDIASIGYTYDGKKFVPPPSEEIKDSVRGKDFTIDFLVSKGIIQKSEFDNFTQATLAAEVTLDAKKP